jgi:hypothetical protein
MDKAQFLALIAAVLIAGDSANSEGSVGPHEEYLRAADRLFSKAEELVDFEKSVS